MPEHLARHGAEVERDAIGHPLVRPQLIATDLDGTIIPYSETHTGYVSPRTLDAFAAAIEAGIGIAFVTGRPMRWMTALAPVLGPMGPAIVSNGAVIYDMNTDRVIEAHPMDQHLVTDVTNQLRSLFSGAIFGAETLTGVHPRLRACRRPRAGSCGLRHRRAEQHGRCPVLPLDRGRPHHRSARRTPRGRQTHGQSQRP